MPAMRTDLGFGGLTTPAGYWDEMIMGGGGGAPVPPEAAPAPPPDNYIPGSTYIPPEQAAAPAPVSDPYAAPTEYIPGSTYVPPAQAQPVSMDQAVGPAQDPYGGYSAAQPLPDNPNGAPTRSWPTEPANSVSPLNPYQGQNLADIPGSLAYGGTNLSTLERKLSGREVQPALDPSVTRLPGTGDGARLLPSPTPSSPAMDRRVGATANNPRDGQFLIQNMYPEPTRPIYTNAALDAMEAPPPTIDLPPAPPSQPTPAPPGYTYGSDGRGGLIAYPAISTADFKAAVDAAQSPPVYTNAALDAMETPQPATTDPYADTYNLRHSDIMTLPPQQPAAQAAGPGTPTLDFLAPAGKAMEDAGFADAAGNIVPSWVTLLTGDRRQGARARDAQDALGQVDSSEAGRAGAAAMEQVIHPAVERISTDLMQGTQTIATGNTSIPRASSGTPRSLWGLSAGNRRDMNQAITAIMHPTPDPYAAPGTPPAQQAVGGTSAGAATPVVNDGDVSRNRASKLLTPDLQFVDSERTSDAWGGGTGANQVRVITGEGAERYGTDALVTPESLQAAEAAGMAGWNLNDAEFQALVDAGLVVPEAKADVVGKTLLIPKDWVDALGGVPAAGEGETLTNVQDVVATDPYAGGSSGGGGGGSTWNNSGSGGGGGWKNYGRSGSYGGGRGSSGGGGGWSDWGSANGSVPASPAWEASGEGSPFDDPIFARYFDVLSRHFGADRASAMMRGGFGRKLGRKGRSRAIGGKRMTTRGRQSVRVPGGASVEFGGDSIRKQVNASVGKAKGKKDN